MQICDLTHPDAAMLDKLVEIWTSSVEATHTFLAREDLEALRPQVRGALAEISCLRGCRDEEGRLLGFLGVEGGKIEMLFIDDAARGKGAGSALLRHAIDVLGCRTVDVNEQNGQGVGFYEHMGFRQFGRSPLDGQGRPYPILHLEWSPLVEL